jgi:hypothetical protein
MSERPNLRFVSIVTAIDVLVATGFSVAGVVTARDGAQVFAMYAAARAIPLAAFALAAIYKRSASALLILGLLAGVIQLADAAVGLVQHDAGKTIGPFVLFVLQMYALSTSRKRLPAA